MWREQFTMFLYTISSGEIDPPGMKREYPHQEARDSWNEHTDDPP